MGNDFTRFIEILIDFLSESEISYRWLRSGTIGLVGTPYESENAQKCRIVDFVAWFSYGCINYTSCNNRLVYVMMSGYDFLKSQDLRRWQKVGSDWNVISSGRVFQTRGPATVKARSPTVERLVGGTSRRLVPPERCPSAGQIGSRNEWFQVPRRTFVYMFANFSLNN